LDEEAKFRWKVLKYDEELFYIQNANEHKIFSFIAIFYIANLASAQKNHAYSGGTSNQLWAECDI
jgi:hypothetical protein